MKIIGKNLLLAVLCYVCSLTLNAQKPSEAIGRWDLQVQYGDQWLPSWLEIKQSGNKALVGHYVSFTGSARPISEVHMNDGVFSFSIPPQWRGTHYMHLTGTTAGDEVSGHLLDHEGKPRAFRGKRAPKLLYPEPTSWSEPRSLIAANSLEGWTVTQGRAINQWVVADGILKSPASGANLMTSETFMDFKLHVEFRYPQGSNSGIYLRGRYEIQVEDSYDKEPDSHYLGGVYGFLTPSENMAEKAGEWQSYDITLVGRRISVVANGKTIIHNQIIPGITGGALDSDEGAPGPIMLQGDHGPVEYRNMTISVPSN